MGWIDSVHCEKFRCDFVERTFALVAPVQPVLYRASCSNKTIQNASKHYETHQNMSLGPNGGIECIHCEKFRCDIVVKTFALISPVQPVLHQASCINETIQNEFMAQTCALIAPVQPILHRVLCSNETLPNAPKYYETHQNMSLGSNGVGRVHSLRKIPKRLHGTNLCINCTSSTHFAPSFVL